MICLLFTYFSIPSPIFIYAAFLLLDHVGTGLDIGACPIAPGK